MNSLNFIQDLFSQIFGERKLTGIDLQLYVNNYQEVSGNATDKSEFKISKTYAFPIKGKKFVAGFTIYEPKSVKELHYLSYWPEAKRKCLLFDAGISSVNDIVEIGKFYIDKEQASKIQRLLNYFNAILFAYFTGRKYLIVGTYFVGSSYHIQLSRVCPKILYEGKVKVQGEKKDIIILYNTRREALKLLIKSAVTDFSQLLKSTLLIKLNSLI